MVIRRKILVCLQLVVALILVWGAAPASADSVMPENKVPGTVESTARRLTHQLEKQGYEVARGYFKLYTKEDCDSSYAVMRTCYSNNPAAPYIMPVLPTWPDEWLDPQMAGVFGPTTEDYSTTFRLDPREAIVILGQLPPPARYFGLQTYAFTRRGQFDQTSEQYEYISTHLPPYVLNMFFSYVPWDHDRIQLLASVGNSINNVVIEKESGAAFNRERFFVITPDKFMDQAVREAFSKTAVKGKDVFTEPISSLLQVGLDEASDDFFTVIRYAMPLDAEKRRPDSDAWREDLPLVVLRIRDPRTERPIVPYAPVQLDPRSKQNPPETALAPELTSLVKAVCEKWGQPCNYDDPREFNTKVPSLLNVQPEPIWMVGPKCIPVGMNCFADTQDTVYHFSRKFPLDAHRVYAVVGALSTQTGNATYVGLGVNTTLRQQGIDNVSDSDLAGSAGGYGSAVTDPNKFFVYYFARDCANLEAWASKYCRSIPESALPDYDPTNPDSDQLNFSLRDYMFPDTARGPDAEFSLSPRVIPLQGP